MFLDVQKEEIQLSNTGNDPQAIYSRLLGLCPDNVKDLVFYGLPRIDDVSFAYSLAGTGAYFVLVQNICVGLVWFSSIRQHSKEIHFLVNPSKYKLDYIAGGKKVMPMLSRQLKVKTLDGKGESITLYGYIPDFNTKALAFTRKIGFTYQGIIPDGATDPNGFRSNMNLIVYTGVQ